MRDAENICKPWLGRVTRSWLVAPLLVALGASTAEDSPFAYVTNGLDPPNGAVSVIDTSTNTVVATVTVPGSSGVAITPS